MNDGNKPQNNLVAFPHNVEILLVMLLSPPNFCMTQSQSFVIKFSSFIFLPPDEVSDSKTTGEGHISLNIYTRRALKVLSSNFFMTQSQSSVISHQVQLLFFYHLKLVITNLRWMRGINFQIIWLHFSNDLEIQLVILLVSAFVPLPQLLQDTKSIFCHQIQFFYFSTT